MTRVLDWFYSRSGCKACSKAKEFLDRNGILPAVVANANRVRFDRLRAFRLAKQVDEVYATRRKFIVHLNLKSPKCDGATLARAILGPSGNLRAPAFRSGRTMVVGWDEGTYVRVLRCQARSLAS
jgi:arsenate reductase-like glutaredoxin family protein